MSDKLMQTIVFAICVAGYVALAVLDEPTAEYVTLIGPVLAVVIIQGRLGKQDEVLTEISENTNGKLDRRIENAVERAVTRANRSEE